MRRPTLVLAALLGLAPSLAAQVPTRDSARVVVLDSLAVRVTRANANLTRIPAAVSVIQGNELRRGRPGIGLDEALGVVPGLYVSNRNNFALGPRVAIRGLGVRTAFGVRGVRVVADGIPLTMPDGQSNLTNLDLLSASGVEVLRGPASALWGNAAGGVLLVRSDVPAGGDVEAEARVVVSDLGSGSDDATNLRRYGLRVAGRTGRVGWVVSGGRLDQRGFRAHSRAEVSNLNAVGRIATGPSSELTVVVNAADAPTAQNPGSLPFDSAQLRPSAAWPNNVRTGSGEQARQIQLGASWSAALHGGRLEAGSWVVDRDLENPLPFGFIDLARTAAGGRLIWGGPIAASLDVTVGADLEHQRDARREFNNVAGERGSERRRDQIDRVTALGPFAQGRLSLGERVTFMATARHDLVRFAVDDRLLDDGRDDSGERNLSATSGFVGATWDARPGWTTWANLATSFQTPTTTELINAPPPAGAPCCPGGFNANLEPQTATSVEAGFRGRIDDHTRIDVTVFTMDVEDAIVPFQIAGIEGRSFFRNAARTRHRGVETSVSFALAGATARAAWTWNRTIFVDDGSAARNHEGNLVPGAPEHRIVVRVSQSIGPALAELNIDRIGEYFVDDANLATNPAATLIDLRVNATGQIGGVTTSPFIALVNAFDKRHNGSVVINAAGGRYYEPAPGRHVMIGLVLRTGRAR